MSDAEFWSALAGVFVPSAVVAFFAWLNHRNAARAATASEKRDAALGDKIDGVGNRLDGRIESLRSDVMSLAVSAAYIAGRQDGAERAGRRPQRPDDAPEPEPGPDRSH